MRYETIEYEDIPIIAREQINEFVSEMAEFVTGYMSDDVYLTVFCVPTNPEEYRYSVLRTFYIGKDWHTSFDRSDKSLQNVLDYIIMFIQKWNRE